MMRWREEVKDPGMDEAMKVLILGGSGMLGHQLARVFAPRFDSHVTFRSAPSVRLSWLDRQRVHTGVCAEYFDSVIQVVAHVRPRAVINYIGVMINMWRPNRSISSICLPSCATPFKGPIQFVANEEFHCDRSPHDARFRQARGWTPRSWTDMVRYLHTESLAEWAA